MQGLKWIAAWEALKGVLVVVAGLGFLAAMSPAVHAGAVHLLEHLHLNPARHVPDVFARAWRHAADARLHQLAGLAALYAALRFAEAYGLWRERGWAQWLSALSGAIYLPFEAVSMLREPSALHAVLLAVNAAIVAYMAWALWRRLRADRAPA